MGVREANYHQSFKRLKEKLNDIPSLKVEPCLWGDRWGAKLNDNGACIPKNSSTAKVIDGEEVSSEDMEIALWGLLYNDPLYELRLYASDTGTLKDTPMGERSPIAKMSEAINKVSSSELFSGQMEDSDLSTFFDKARKDILASPALASAASKAQDNLNVVVARALVARTIQILFQEEKVCRLIGDADMRDKVVEGIESSLKGGNSQKRMYTPLLHGIGWVSTWFLERKRIDMTNTVYPGPGDILLYQAKGQNFRDFIKNTIKNEGLSKPITLLAHSLGGVMCVDLLIQENLDVALLITVGSQSPFFYEINALQASHWRDDIQNSKRLPSHFPKWVNIYDRRDFLSYIGEPIFGDTRVRDFQVDNRQPFPISHISYWDNDKVWEIITTNVKESIDGTHQVESK